MLKQLVVKIRAWTMSYFSAAFYWSRNICSRGLVVSANGKAVVSLTSYGKRIDQVYLAIESIGFGISKPKRIILWLDDKEEVLSPRKSLRRLMNRGLELRHTRNYGPHKKYYPYYLGHPSEVCPLVTADDDVFYPRCWLNLLVENHEKYPEHIVAHRARRIRTSDSWFEDYSSWSPAPRLTCSFANFAVGVGGVLYPSSFAEAILKAGDDFLVRAPRADDVWLHHLAVKDGREVFALNELPHWRFPDVRRLRAAHGLAAENVLSGGNDIQISATYSPELYQLVHDATQGG